MSSISTMHLQYRPSADDPFDRVKAAHLLNRAGFGGTEAEIDKVLELGPQKAVDWLMDFPDLPAEEQGEDVPDLSPIEGYPRTFRELREMLARMDEDRRRETRQMLQRAQREAIQTTAHWWLKRMADGPHPLQEKLALFWHGHFTTSAQDTQSAWRIWQQNELLRRMAAGNFRTFVQQISRDPAMLDYLNNQQNRRRSPNENYARELMELFTLGIGNYSEQDVKEAARAFTGWGHDGESFTFRRNDHDDGEKEFMGFRGRFNGDDIIDIILMHPACAPYICGRLYRYFVHEEPDNRILTRLGRTLVQSGYELRPVLRTILTSRAFYSPTAIGRQIKSPIQLVIGTVRKLGMELPESRMLTAALRQMGQVPFYPPNVQGWPGGRRWINSSTLFVRYNTCVRLVGAGTFAGASPFRGFGGTPPEEVVDAWVSKLIQRPIEGDKKQVLALALGDSTREQAVRRMAQLLVATPEYQVC